MGERSLMGEKSLVASRCLGLLWGWGLRVLELLLRYWWREWGALEVEQRVSAF